MIEARAPGKLFVIGEYAVVEPGGEAVVVAVDRHVTVRVEASERGLVRSAQYERSRGWRHTATGVVPDDDRPADHVLAAIRAVEALAAERGAEPRPHAIDVTSELDDADGRKLGLGSSAAVTIAVIRALGRFHRLGLTPREEFGLALIATLEVAPAASGGDLAASCFGGWIAYRSPDRARIARLRERHGVLAALREPWPELEIRPLPEPTGLDLLVGWTGEPASTPALVGDVRTRRDGAGYERFLSESRDRVGEFIAGALAGDAERVLSSVRAARRLLAGLGETLGLEIETPALACLCEAAETVGGAAKPSGAGGGDCGIALIPHGAELGPLLNAWETAGIRRLPLAVQPPERLGHAG